MAEFKHKIGDALYDLYVPADSGDEETVRYPIVSRTERYVYVEERIGRHQRIRFNVADLERDGHDFNRANLMMLHVRPGANWPLMPAEVRKPQQPAIAPP